MKLPIHPHLMRYRPATLDTRTLRILLQEAREALPHAEWGSKLRSVKKRSPALSATLAEDTARHRNTIAAIVEELDVRGQPHD